MKREKNFFGTVCAIAVPVALQSMLQASFGMVDQIMIGQLGSVSVAAVGLAGKFSWIFSVLSSAIGAVAGIMMSQYLGQENKGEVRRSFFVNLFLTGALAVLFTALCFCFPQRIMRLYTNDPQTLTVAAAYLRIVSAAFLPMAGATLLAALLRCAESAVIPLYASVAAALLNTGLNYILIFGKLGTPAMGAAGAAAATAVSQLANFLLMLALLGKHRKWLEKEAEGSADPGAFGWKQYGTILLPILVCELMWSLGENVYTAIYGHMGTQAGASMILINPVQGLMIGALCGLSQAAGVLIGKKLGGGKYDEAYRDSGKLMVYGFAGSIIFSGIVVLISAPYVEIYQVEAQVKLQTRQILTAYALIAPFKVQNMILGGGILRSGGKTKYVMAVDLIGTWIFGVPIGLLAAFVWKLPVPYVYFLLSLEECVRFLISVMIFKRKKWMRQLV